MKANTYLGIGALLVAGAISAYYVVGSPLQARVQTLSFGEPIGPGHSMAPPDTSFIPVGAPIVAARAPVTLSANAEIGKRAYEAKCAACHGVDGAGTNGTAPPLIHFIYAPGHHPDDSFVAAAMNGVQAHHWLFGDMAPVEGVTPGVVKYITAYIREVQRFNGIPRS